MTLDRTGKHQPTTDVAIGRPSVLTDEVADCVLAAVRNHQRLEVAAELAGVGRSTVYGWLHAGARAKSFLADGGDPAGLTDLERRCAAFSEAVMKAMSIAEGTAIDGILRAGMEPSVETKRIRRCAGVVDGEPVFVEEVSTTERPPDARALQWWLERRVPAYHLRQSLELTGGGGGPVEIEFAARLAVVTDKIKRYQETQAAIVPDPAVAEKIKRHQEAHPVITADSEPAGE